MRRLVQKVVKIATGKCPRCRGRGKVVHYGAYSYGKVPCKVCQ